MATNDLQECERALLWLCSRTIICFPLDFMFGHEFICGLIVVIIFKPNTNQIKNNKISRISVRADWI